MDDRLLLEMAAKAYWGDEIDDVCSVEWDNDDQCIAYTHGDNQDHNGQDRTFLWNPLADDGDALRLAVKLNLRLVFHPVLNQALVRPYHGNTFEDETREDGEKHPDPYAATRRAITRAAAEIGKQMP